HDNPRNETCKAINLRSREVPSPVVVEKPCEKKVASEEEEDESEEKNEGEVEQKSDCEIEEESKSKLVEKDSSVKKGKKPLANESKYQDPSPYARVP
ncbi:hypothetical protein A2U01_0075161, partial [Trifolium medium]|nr:hypothetical protein [Trifolium medium]